MNFAMSFLFHDEIKKRDIKKTHFSNIIDAILLSSITFSPETANAIGNGREFKKSHQEDPTLDQH